MESSDLLHRAILLARTGDKSAARQMLDEVVQAEPYNTTAWFWLADTQETYAERASVLEACLRFNPDSKPVRNALAALCSQLDREKKNTSGTASPSWAAVPQPENEEGPAEPSLPVDGLTNTRRVRTISWLYYAFGAFLLVGIIVLIVNLIPHRAVGYLTQEAIDLENDPVQTDISESQSTPIKRNDIVHMEGLLVDARTRFLGMEYWVNTSMQREDTGQGACETFYVTRLVVNGKEYR